MVGSKEVLGKLLKTVARNLMLLAFLLFLGFILPRLVPGSPLALRGDEIGILNERLPAATFNRFSEYYAPHEPLIKQLTNYIVQLFRGEWGYSFHYGTPVRGLIVSRIGWTLGLAFVSIVLSAVIGIAMGTWLAYKDGRPASRGILMLVVTLQAIPAFLLAVIIQLIFAHRLGWFPAYGAYPPGMRSSDAGYWWQVARRAFLPLMVLVVSRLPTIVLLSRNVVQRVKGQPFVELARYNNVSPIWVLVKYVLRNSMPEILGRLNIQCLYAIAGALYVEMVYSYPGIGSLMKTAVSARDYPLIQGLFLVISLFSIGINLVFELALGKVNPRLEL